MRRRSSPRIRNSKFERRGRSLCDGTVGAHLMRAPVTRAPVTYQRCRKIRQSADDCARKTRAYGRCLNTPNPEWVGGGFGSSFFYLRSVTGTITGSGSSSGLFTSALSTLSTPSTQAGLGGAALRPGNSKNGDPDDEPWQFWPPDRIRLVAPISKAFTDRYFRWQGGCVCLLAIADLLSFS